MPEAKYFVFQSNGSKSEGMNKEQIINAIEEATGVVPVDPNAGFITAIVELNRNKLLKFWKGTQAEFNALTTRDSNTLYIIDDDTTVANLADLYGSLAGLVNGLLHDTGWKDITRLDPSDEPIVIGAYRIIGKTAFVSIDYDPAWFNISDYYDEFNIPVALGNGDQNPQFSFVETDNDDNHYCGLMSVTAFAEPRPNTSQINAYSHDFNGTLGHVNAMFSYPIA